MDTPLAGGFVTVMVKVAVGVPSVAASTLSSTDVFDTSRPGPFPAPLPPLPPPPPQLARSAASTSDENCSTHPPERAPTVPLTRRSRLRCCCGHLSSPRETGKVRHWRTQPGRSLERRNYIIRSRLGSSRANTN